LNHRLKQALFLASAIVVLHPAISTVLCLGIGLIYGLLQINPYANASGKISGRLLKISIIFLGFTISLTTAADYAWQNLVVIFTAISFTLLLARLCQKLLKTNTRLTWLLASGTAICGGSAIAAVAPLIQARKQEIATALTIVFVLNAAGLLIFPIIGHWLDLSDYQFGVWSALAIHDTSSVVGAAAAFSDESLRVATPIKLARALWIIPLVMLFIMLDSRRDWRSAKFPWFILGFMATSTLTLWPALHGLLPIFGLIAKSLLKLSLFLLGASLNLEEIKTVGTRPILQALILWSGISLLTLTWVYYY